MGDQRPRKHDHTGTKIQDILPDGRFIVSGNIPVFLQRERAGVDNILPCPARNAQADHTGLQHIQQSRRTGVAGEALHYRAACENRQELVAQMIEIIDAAVALYNINQAVGDIQRVAGNLTQSLGIDKTRQLSVISTVENGIDLDVGIAREPGKINRADDVIIRNGVVEHHLSHVTAGTNADELHIEKPLEL